jgi:hypothetical protein
VGQDREPAAMAVLGLGDAELEQDVTDVRLDSPL